MTIEIRPATPADAGAVLALVRALAVYEREPDAVHMTAEMAARALAQGHCRALLATDGARPVAIALYFFNFSTWTGTRGLYLEDLFVAPEARKTGLGLALLKRLAAMAVAEGCKRMEWSVLSWNDSAKGFYQRIGAAPAQGWETWRLQGEALQALAR